MLKLYPGRDDARCNDLYFWPTVGLNSLSFFKWVFSKHNTGTREGKRGKGRAVMGSDEAGVSITE